MVGVLAAFAILLLSFAISGLWWWFGFVIVLLAILGAFELLSIRKTGKTLSRQYSELVRERPVIGGLLTAVLGGFFGYLLFHLVSGW